MALPSALFFCTDFNQLDLGRLADDIDRDLRRLIGFSEDLDEIVFSREEARQLDLQELAIGIKENAI